MQAMPLSHERERRRGQLGRVRLQNENVMCNTLKIKNLRFTLIVLARHWKCVIECLLSQLHAKIKLTLHELIVSY